MKIDSPLVSVTKVLAKSMSWTIFPSFTNRTYANSSAYYNNYSIMLIRRFEVKIRWILEVHIMKFLHLPPFHRFAIAQYRCLMGLFWLHCVKLNGVKPFLKFLWQLEVLTLHLWYGLFPILQSILIYYKKQSNHHRIVLMSLRISLRLMVPSGTCP